MPRGRHRRFWACSPDSSCLFRKERGKTRPRSAFILPAILLDLFSPAAVLLRPCICAPETSRHFPHLKKHLAGPYTEWRFSCRLILSSSRFESCASPLVPT